MQTFNSYIEDGNQRAAEFEFDLFKAHQRGGFKDEPQQNQKFRALVTQHLVDVFSQGGQDGRNDSSSNGGGGGDGSNNSNESLPFSGIEDSNGDVSSLEPLDSIYVMTESLAAQFQGFKESITDHVQNHLRAMKTSITNNLKLMLQEQQAHADSQRALLPASSATLIDARRPRRPLKHALPPGKAVECSCPQNCGDFSSPKELHGYTFFDNLPKRCISSSVQANNMLLHTLQHFFGRCGQRERGSFHLS